MQCGVPGTENGFRPRDLPCPSSQEDRRRNRGRVFMDGTMVLMARRARVNVIKV